MGFTVELRNSVGVVVSTPLGLYPSFFSAHAVGGYLRAEVRVTGNDNAVWDILGWLNYEIIIKNSTGTIVWAGYVVEATVTRPALTIGLSLEKMANKVQVVFNETLPDGTEEQGTTEWASDAGSIALYGTKEKQVSVSDTTLAVANAKRDTNLATLKNPLPIISFDGSDPGGVLVCTGLWQTLDWFYYGNSVGKEVYDVSKDTEHGIGWGLASNLIGFNESGIHDIQARLDKFPRDNQIRVTGTTILANDGVYTIQSVPDSEKDIVKTYTATTISFEPNDDVLDSAQGLSFARSGEMVKVTGAVNPDNNGYRWVKTTGAARIEISSGPTILANASAGPSITIAQGHKLKIQEGVDTELPGSNLTLASVGTKLAQKFTNSSATAWSAKEISLYVARVGSPADLLRVSLYSSSGTTPNAQLATATIGMNDVTLRTDWISFTLSTGVTLNPGTEYWIVVERTGAVAYDNYWVVGLETGLLTASMFRIWDASSWIARTPDARMPFQIWSHKETTQIMRSILTANTRIRSISIQVNSGIEEREWRAGDQKALAELEKLIDSGTSTGRRIMVKSTVGGGIIVYAEPDPTALDLIYTVDGRVRRPSSEAWEEGVLPVGEYVRLEEVPVMGSVVGLSTVLVQEAEYDVESGELRLTPWAMDEDLEY